MIRPSRATKYNRPLKLSQVENAGICIIIIFVLYLIKNQHDKIWVRF